MLVQTLVLRRSEAVLARIDRWVVEHVLPRVGTDNPLAERVVETLGSQFDLLGNKLASVIEPAIHGARGAGWKSRYEASGADRPVRRRSGAPYRLAGGVPERC